MNIAIGEFLLRCPELQDLKMFYQYKNDSYIAAQLGGFTTGYSEADLHEWLEFHRKCKNEMLLSIAYLDNNQCVGHVGLYNIDFRVRSAEYAILIGDKALWGKGVGKRCTMAIVKYGFEEMNLNRIYLSVLATNLSAIALYNSTGFIREGTLKQAQYKNGHYIDVVLMSLLRNDFERTKLDINNIDEK